MIEVKGQSSVVGADKAHALRGCSGIGRRANKNLLTDALVNKQSIGETVYYFMYRIVNYEGSSPSSLTNLNFNEGNQRMLVIQANTPEETRDAVVKWLNSMASNHRIAAAKLAGMHKRDIETARATPISGCC